MQFATKCVRTAVLSCVSDDAGSVISSAVLELIQPIGRSAGADSILLLSPVFNVSDSNRHFCEIQVQLHLASVVTLQPKVSDQ